MPGSKARSYLLCRLPRPKSRVHTSGLSRSAVGLKHCNRGKALRKLYLFLFSMGRYIAFFPRSFGGETMSDVLR